MRTTINRLRRMISTVLVEAVESQKAREDILKFLYDEPDNEHTADDLEYFSEWFCDSTSGYGEEDYEAIEALAAQMVNDGSIQVHVTPDYELLYHPDKVPGGSPSKGSNPVPQGPPGHVVVHFPSEYFSHGYLESNFMEAPSQPKFVTFDPNGEEYQVEGSYDDLQFIWNENYGDTPGNFDDYILHRYLANESRKRRARLIKETWDTPEEVLNSKCPLCAQILWDAGFNMWDQEGNEYECPQTGTIYTIVGPEQVQYYHPSGRTKTINATQLEARIHKYH